MPRTKKADTAKVYTIDKDKLKCVVNSCYINGKRITQEQVSGMVFKNKKGYTNFIHGNSDKLAGEFVKNFCDQLNLKVDDFVRFPEHQPAECESDISEIYDPDVLEWLESIFRKFQDFRKYDYEETSQKILELLESINHNLELIIDNEKCLLDEWRGGRND